jgi:hypothetical protein
LVALAAFFEEKGGVAGLLDTISDAATWDEQISEGKALSEHEEAVLQALDLITQEANSTVWVRASTLREQVAKLLGQSVEQMGHTQWIAHILKRLHLLDESKRKRDTDGMMYAIDPDEVSDMMRRYEVMSIAKMEG